MCLQLSVFLVTLAGETIDVNFYVPHKLSATFSAVGFIASSDQTFVGCERNLGVNYYGPVIGKPYDDIWPQCSSVFRFEL
jgi:hypothetical protein